MYVLDVCIITEMLMMKKESDTKVEKVEKPGKDAGRGVQGYLYLYLFLFQQVSLAILAGLSLVNRCPLHLCSLSFPPLHSIHLLMVLVDLRLSLGGLQLFPFAGTDIINAGVLGALGSLAALSIFNTIKTRLLPTQLFLL
jgi:hypothetical protein